MSEQDITAFLNRGIPTLLCAKEESLNGSTVIQQHPGYQKNNTDYAHITAMSS